MTDTARDAYLASEAASVKMPYLLLGIFLVIIAVTFLLNKFPDLRLAMAILGRFPTVQLWLPHQAKAQVIVLSTGQPAAAYAAAHHLGLTMPVPAADNAMRGGVPDLVNWIITLVALVYIGFIAILAPFSGIPQQVIKTPPIGLKTADRRGGRVRGTRRVPRWAGRVAGPRHARVAQ